MGGRHGLGSGDAGGGAGLLPLAAESGATSAVPAAALLVLIGAAPRTGWLPAGIERDRAGYLLTGTDVQTAPPERPPLLFETSMPGVFTVGDVRHGSVKRVASAVGEGSVAIHMVHDHLAVGPAG